MKHPRILVDWLPMDDRGQHFVLRAAILFAGRSFPIYERVHYKDACPICQRHLLDALTLLIPEGAQPILVTDAGFRVTLVSGSRDPRVVLRGPITAPGACAVYRRYLAVN